MHNSKSPSSFYSSRSTVEYLSVTLQNDVHEEGCFFFFFKCIAESADFTESHILRGGLTNTCDITDCQEAFPGVVFSTHRCDGKTEGRNC